MRYLLDTNVISELWRPFPAVQVLNFLSRNDDDMMAVSAMTIAELRFGAFRHPDPVRSKKLMDWIDATVFRFRERIVDFDIRPATWYGEKAALVEKMGRPVTTRDLIIGASAAANNLVLVTRNERHFQPLGVPIVNPRNLDTA
jgi:predicted nucleic acid-binding protein